MDVRWVSCSLLSSVGRKSITESCPEDEVRLAVLLHQIIRVYLSYPLICVITVYNHPVIIQSSRPPIQVLLSTAPHLQNLLNSPLEVPRINHKSTHHPKDSFPQHEIWVKEPSKCIVLDHTRCRSTISTSKNKVRYLWTYAKPVDFLIPAIIVDSATKSNARRDNLLRPNIVVLICCSNGWPDDKSMCFCAMLCAVQLQLRWSELVAFFQRRMTLEISWLSAPSQTSR